MDFGVAKNKPSARPVCSTRDKKRIGTYYTVELQPSLTERRAIATIQLKPS